MSSINEVYQELKANLQRHERIFKHFGVPKRDGGWYQEPKFDNIDGYRVAQLRVFYINPKQTRQRMNELAVNGWKEFTPEKEPVGLKDTDTASRSSRQKKKS